MEFRVLGPVEVLVDDVPARIGSATQRTLLALLLAHPNEVVSTDRIVDALWPDDPLGARRKLWFHVSKLRRILRPDDSQGTEGVRLVARSTGYMLRVRRDELDSTRFEDLTTTARALLPHAAAEAAETLRAALALWRGDPFADVPHEDALAVEAARLSETRLTALEARLGADLALGRGGELIPELEALVAQHPFREHFHGQLMVALYRAGRQADALAAYLQARRTLVDELGIEPSEELQELQRQVLAHDPALAGTPLGPYRRSQASPAGEPAAPETAPAAMSREERKVLTVLFADLVDFTTTAEQLDPEDIRASLMPSYAHIRSEIERFGGRVEKFIGDAVIALFGAPVTREDDAERAVRAALAIRDSLAKQARPQQVRIAVATGQAHVTLAGRHADAEPTAVGAVVNNAARMQSVAAVNSVLVGEQTFRATRHVIEYRGAEPIAVKGKSEPISVWEAIRALALPGVDPLRHRSPFVGRERELAALRERLAWAASQRAAQLVTILGVPGIGKTRLLSELQQAAARADEPVTWRQGRSLPYGDGVSFWALGEIVKAEAGVLESDSAENVELKLANSVARVLDDPGEARRVATSLGILIGLGGGEKSTGDGRPDTFAAWRDFVEALADQRLLVLVFEDLHWADEGLLDFVDELVDRVSGVPLLVIATARPELLRRRSGWAGGKPNAITISLPPLSDGDTARLVAALLEQPVGQAEVRDAILARAGGNPLYAEQFCRMLLERGALREMPESVHGIIAARLDGLASEQKRLLQYAAVVGKVFWTGALEAIGGVSRQSAEELLHVLERSEFVYRARRSSVAGDSEHAFRHDLLRDVAYGEMPRAGRGELHRLTAEWIDSLGHPEDHAELLAHHYLAALEYAEAAGEDVSRLVEPAVVALRRAGLRAIRLSANDRAIQYLSRSIELVQKLDEGDERNRTEADLQLQLATALFALKGFTAPEVEQAYVRATELMMSSAPVVEQFPVQLGLAIHYGERGEFDRSARLVDRMMELASEGDESMMLQALHARWMYSLFHGRIDDAIAAAEEARAIYRPDVHHQLSFRYGNHDPGVCAMTLGAIARALRGESVQAVTQMLEAVSLSDVLDHAVTRAHPRAHLPFVHEINGDVHAARLASEQALALEDNVVHPTFFLHAHAVHGWAISREGDYDEGVAELETTLTNQLRIADYIFGVIAGALLAEVHIRRDRLEAARAVIDQLRSVTTSMGTYFSEPELYRVEAECFRLEGSEADARRLLLQAIDTARKHGSWAFAVRAASQLVRTSSAVRETDLKVLGDLYKRLSPENDTDYGREANALLGEFATNDVRSLH